MREILFRGKRVSDGKWVYGSYIKATFHWHNHGIHEDWIATSAHSNGGWFALGCKYPVVADTVGQFTGVIDKNGQPIFEGDVVIRRSVPVWEEYTDENGMHWIRMSETNKNDKIGTVAYNDKTAKFEAGNDEIWLGMHEDVEVIGNAYDNAKKEG